MRSIVLSVVSMLSLLSIHSSLAAQEWTRFRGPNGSGLSDADGIPVSWTEDDYRWVADVPGIGHSHPVVWGDRLFLTTAVDDGKKRMVLCLSTVDGSKLWERSVDSETHSLHARNSFASGSAALDGERVYVNFGSPSQNLVVAWTHDGEEVWRRDLGKFVGTHGHAMSPIVHEDLVIVSNEQGGRGEIPTESFLVALDSATGAVRWKTPRTTARVSYSTPCVYHEDGGAARIVFTSLAHGIVSVDARTGKPVWEAKCFDLRTCSSPLLWKDLVFGTCGSGGGGNYLVAMRRGGEGDVLASHEAYRLNRAVAYVPTPIIRGDRLFMFADKGGVVSCYDVETGKPIWQERLDGRPEFSGSPICVGDKLYCISHEGDVYVVRAADEFELLAKNSLGRPSRCTPAVAGGRMYLRAEGVLICIGGDEAAAGAK